MRLRESILDFLEWLWTKLTDEKSHRELEKENYSLRLRLEKATGEPDWWD